MRSKIIITLCAVLLMSFQLGAQGIHSNTEGFGIRLTGQYVYWASNSNFIGSISEESPSGPGIGFSVSYGFNENLAAVLSYEFNNIKPGTEFDSYHHQPFSLGVQYHFGASLDKFRPYLQALAGWNAFSIRPVFYEDNDGNFIEMANLKMNGLFIGGGLGVQYYIKPDFCLDLSFAGRFGNFNKFFVNGTSINPGDENVDFRLFTFSLGGKYSFY